MGSGNNGQVDFYCLDDGCYIIEYVNPSGTIFVRSNFTLTAHSVQSPYRLWGAILGNCPYYDAGVWTDYPSVSFNAGSATECTIGCQIPQACT